MQWQSDYLHGLRHPRNPGEVIKFHRDYGSSMRIKTTNEKFRYLYLFSFEMLLAIVEPLKQFNPELCKTIFDHILAE